MMINPWFAHPQHPLLPQASQSHVALLLLFCNDLGREAKEKKHPSESLCFEKGRYYAFGTIVHPYDEIFWGWGN